MYFVTLSALLIHLVPLPPLQRVPQDVGDDDDDVDDDDDAAVSN